MGPSSNISFLRPNVGSFVSYSFGAVSQSIINIIFYHQNQLKYAVKTDPIFAGMKTEEPHFSRIAKYKILTPSLHLMASSFY